MRMSTWAPMKMGFHSSEVANPVDRTIRMILSWKVRILMSTRTILFLRHIIIINMLKKIIFYQLIEKRILVGAILMSSTRTKN